MQQQLKRLCSEIQNLLADNLIGIYLHGSLAMGFFNPSHSDIDLLVVDRASIPPARKRDLGEFLLYLSNHPIPIEIHFLVYSDLHPWQYPPRFDFHYSEGWRARYEIDLQSDAWQAWDNPDQQDPDLGAHVAVARARGTVLIGPPVEMVFPLIPHADYLAPCGLISKMHSTRSKRTPSITYSTSAVRWVICRPGVSYQKQKEVSGRRQICLRVFMR